MTKAIEVSAMLSSPKELAAFLVSPKAYITGKGLAENTTSIKDFEHYARTLIENINAANRSVGISTLENADWGIGAGCCNKQAMFK